MGEDGQREIVIIGGGVIGCCAAYYLSRHPSYDAKKHSITLIEATKIAGGASGLSGGCLAAWAEPACLGAASFQLHAELAGDHDGENNWGYRRCFSADCDAVAEHLDDPDARTPVHESLDWVDRIQFKWYKPLGETAQCHPYLFTTTLARLAEEKGVRFVEGSVTSIDYSQDRQRVRAVSLRNKQSAVQQVLATDVIVAAGPWTSRILSEAPIIGEKSHSVVVQPNKEISSTILFFDPGHIDPDDKENHLEIYPRPDGTVYMCGRTKYGLELPATTDEVDVDPQRCQEIMNCVNLISPDLGKSQVLKRQACYRPMVNVQGRDPGLGPLLGPTGIEGLLVAAGHNEWGIQNSPITGKVLSELIFDGKAISADIRELDPRDHLHVKQPLKG
ncbi:FAD dependent oxidoreductase [Xylariaceae sp. AK1471]|nr:FAD dependent oxidoreductase [Xylariaceae sp. AK1471]